MDSRFEVAYPVDPGVENLNFYDGKQGWWATLNRYQTDALLVPIWSPIEKILSQDNLNISLNWIRVYCDDEYSTYMRSGLPKKYPYVDMRGPTIVGTFP